MLSRHVARIFQGEMRLLRKRTFDTNYDVYRYIDLYCFCVRQIVIPYFNLYPFFCNVKVSVCAPQNLRNLVVLVIVLSLEETFIYVFCMTSRYHIFSRNLAETPFAKEAEKFVYDNLRA